MKALQTLPEGYRELLSVDLKNDKKLAILINALAFAIMLLMVVLMHVRVPLGKTFNMSQPLGFQLLRSAVMLAAMAAYIMLHEAVHGVVMKLCGTKKVNFGVTLMYAYAGSDDYYDKSGYLLIALAPVLVWGVVLAVVNLLVPTQWFWVVYFVQILNVSGAAGDFYVTARFCFLPSDILVSDCGTSMKVYSRY